MAAALPTCCCGITLDGINGYFSQRYEKWRLVFEREFRAKNAHETRIEVELQQVLVDPWLLTESNSSTSRR